jgi:hypothetical protein
MSEWISVEDRLPEKDWQNVLVFCDEGNTQVTKYHSQRHIFKWEKAYFYSRKKFGKYSGHFELCHELGYKITHWMPLPEPPKARGES